MNDEERFWSKVAKSDGCWVWTASTNQTPGRGYGRISIAGRLVYAHRYSYELACGPIPEGLTIDHLCRNTLCVNPHHLEVVSRSQNIYRALVGEVERGASITYDKCVRGHEFTPENTYLHGGRRNCIECRRTASRERHRANRDVMNARRRELYAAAKEQVAE